MPFLTALRHRPFAWLWTGQTASRLGDSVYRLALAWWVLEHTGSPEAMSLVLLCSFAPMVAALLLGGVLVDRLPRLGVMLASDVLHGLIVAALAWLAAAGRLDLWEIAGAGVVFGLVDALFQPAYVAAVPEITPPGLLGGANALTALSGQITSVVGPGLGAALVGLGGTPLAFGLNALSYALSAACVALAWLARERAPNAPAPAAPVEPEPPRAGLLADLREGLQAVAARRWLWITILVTALSNMLGGGAHLVALPFLVQDNLGAGVGGLGLVDAAFALGSIGAAVALGRMARLRRRGWWIYGGLISDGLMTLALGALALLPLLLPGRLAGLALAAVGLGIGSTATELALTHARQELIPAHLLGRVYSVDQLGYFALVPVGIALAGWLTPRLGAPGMFLIAGAVGVLLALAGLGARAVRRLD